MQATEVKYERLANLGGRYENLRIGITVRLEDGESAELALTKARRFVETNLALAGAAITLPDEDEDDAPF